MLCAANFFYYSNRASDEKQCKIELMQTEQNTIEAMFDNLGQRESETKKRLHNVRTTTDKGAKPMQQRGRLYQQYAAKYAGCKLYKAIIKDLNQMHEDLTKSLLAKQQENVDFAEERIAPSM